MGESLSYYDWQIKIHNPVNMMQPSQNILEKKTLLVRRFVLTLLNYIATAEFMSLRLNADYNFTIVSNNRFCNIWVRFLK